MEAYLVIIFVMIFMQRVRLESKLQQDAEYWNTHIVYYCYVKS